MDDVISRQAAIDVADAVWSVTGDKNVAKVWDQIKDLPSAQPELIEKAAYIRGFEQGRTQGIIDTKAEKAAQQEITLESAIDYLHSIGWMQKHDKEMTDSAYSDGYTYAEGKYRKMWDEMRDNIKEKAFGKRKGLINTADIDSMPTIDPKPIKEGLLPDGTLHLFTDTDLSKVDRVWVSQNGTHFGDLYYADGEPKIGKWVGIKEYCDHLNEEAEREGKGNRYMPSGMNTHVYCNQCWEPNDRRTTYCPNCSARMVQEGEDNDRA